LDRRLGGPQSRSGRGGEERIPSPRRESNPIAIINWVLSVVEHAASLHDQDTGEKEKTQKEQEEKEKEDFMMKSEEKMFNEEKKKEVGGSEEEKMKKTEEDEDERRKRMWKIGRGTKLGEGETIVFVCALF
jgi:hypothetical protein